VSGVAFGYIHKVHNVRVTLIFDLRSVVTYLGQLSICSFSGFPFLRFHLSLHSFVFA
jgi:hypothetical protein